MSDLKIAPVRKWHEYTDDEFSGFDALDALTTYAHARRAWENADAGGDFDTFSHAEHVMSKCSSVLIQIERERNAAQARVDEATALINAAIELMRVDQLSKWTGVRAWLEQVTP
jgi:hypothetical protein